MAHPAPHLGGSAGSREGVTQLEGPGTTLTSRGEGPRPFLSFLGGNKTLRPLGHGKAGQAPMVMEGATDWGWDRAEAWRGTVGKP